ncbi:hypothetical protein T484DRAFT_1803187 [Baffinella frigidus]|nr:hypothetical protein T484DRAFT_1803187 [Cryptophyta sp. CCMP2293]
MAAREKADEEPPAADTQKAGHTGVTSVDGSRRGEEASTRALAGLKEADTLTLTSDWDGACKQMLYAHAALRFCEGGKAEMDGVETLLKALQTKLPEEERGKLAALVRDGSASQPIWASVKHTAPRADRPEWGELLAELPAVEERARDAELDGRILRGHEIVGANLKQLKRVVRFLVSSTFTDTNEERNLFLGDVMPALQALGRKLKLEVHMCEMRWGIRSEASAAHLTAGICMRELERCLRESAGLCYVFIAAQKYGFRPFPRLIPENLFAQLLVHVADGGDRTLLEKWFTLDANALPGDDVAEQEWEGPREFYGTGPGASGRFYVLQSQSKLADGEGWWPLFERLQGALRGAAKTLFPDETSEAALRDPENTHFAQRFFISVTEEEFKRGLLWVSPERQQMQTLVLQRTVEALEEAKDGLWIDTKEVQDAQGTKVKVVDAEAQLLLSRQIAMIPPHVPSFAFSLAGESKKAGLDKQKAEDCAYLRKVSDDFGEAVARSMVQGAQKLAVTRDETVDEAGHHLRFAVVRADKFCDTETTGKVVAAVQEYLSRRPDGSGQAFVVYGRSGAGKTYLMSKIMVKHIKEQAGKGVVVVRFLGTSPAASSVQPLLTSVCEQLRRCYAKMKQVPSDFKDLQAYFQVAAAEWPSVDQPLSLFFDSVDQLDDSNAGRRLEWLPMSGLSPHVRLVISTLPDHAEFQCLSQLKKGLGLADGASESSCIVEVETISEHIWVLTRLLKLQGRALTPEQDAAVDKAFRERGEDDGAGTPLWLTIVAQIVGQWTSYEGVKFGISPSVQGLIVELFERLEATHGTHLVRAVLAYLTLCMRSGVSETELVHLLSLDDDVLADIYEWWVPPMRTCPPLVLAMLLAELAPYLSRRGDGSGQELLLWYHRQFWEAAAEYLFGKSKQQREGFSSREERHTQLADFFSGKWAGAAKPYSAWLSERVQRPQFCPGETAGDRMVPTQPLVLEGRLTSAESERLLNTRRIQEHMHHAIRAGDEASAVGGLCSIQYVAAKAAVDDVSELLLEYTAASERFPDKAAALGEFAAFVGRNLDALRQKIPTAPFQFALQEPDTSGPYRSFKRLAEEGGGPLIAIAGASGAENAARLVLWRDKPQQSEPCQLTIREHAKPVHAVAFSRCGKWVASKSNDNTFKICSADTGEVKCTLTSHSSKRNRRAFSADGKRVVSASGELVKVWNCETGAEVCTLTGHSWGVNSVAISADGKRVVSGADDKLVKIWDADKGAEGYLAYKETYPPRTLPWANAQGVHAVTGHSHHVCSVAFSADGKRVVRGAQDNLVKIWDADKFFQDRPAAEVEAGKKAPAKKNEVHPVPPLSEDVRGRSCM